MTLPNGTRTPDHWVTPDKLNGKEIKQLTGAQISTPFHPYDRLFPDFDNGAVFDHDWDALDMATMLSRSGRARGLEQVLTLPIRRADWRIVGDGPGATLVQDTLSDRLPKLIAEMTGAVIYRRSFHEVTWEMRNGQAVPKDIAWRPPQACEAGFDPATGRHEGFRQRIAYPGGYVLPGEGRNTLPGYVYVPRQRAFIHTHGAYRDPIHGLSDMDVAYFWWDVAQKILFLLAQFLENQALPQTVVYGADPTEAQANADVFADQKSGGVIGMQRPGDPAAKVFEIIESSGKGSGQFMDTISFCNSEMVASVLAGFTELAAAARQGRTGTGSYALSQDQSEFFLSSRQAVADEMAETIRADLFRPLVAYNLGAAVPVPKLEIGPLADDDLKRALDMLGKVVTAPALNVPQEFIDQLVAATAGYLGLDPEKLQAALAEQAKQKAAQAQAAADSPVGEPQPPAGSAPGQPAAKLGAVSNPRPRPAAPGAPQGADRLATAVDVAHQLVTRARAGENPKRVLAQLGGKP